MRSQQTQHLSILTLVLLSSLTANAAPPNLLPQPDAGQTLRELQKEPDLTPSKVATPLRIEGESASKGSANNDVRIEVKAIHISGNSVFTASELEALVANLVGGEHSLAEINAGAARITAYYREHGYVVARAYLPAQDIKDGVVVIKVLEGVVGQKHVDNKSLLSTERANGYLSGIKSGDVLQAKQADRALLLLNDTPGVGGARATLQPGASVGTSDLVVELTPAAPFSGDVELDDYGNRYTGVNRLGAAVALNSPLKIGDQLSLRVLATDQDMNYGRLAYQSPLGNSGLHVGAAYSDTSYKLGKEFALLQSHGTATSSSVFAVYPFIRSQASNLSGTFTLEDKKLKDLTDSTSTLSDKQVRLANLGLTGNHQDTMGGGGVSSMDLSLVSGRVSMDTGSSDAQSVLQYNASQTDGSFARFDYTFNRLQHLTDSNMFSVALSGQQSNKNLNSSEKFTLGGAYGVRAYPQGEGSGDEGWLTNLELRHSFMDALQGVLFFDAGSVTISRNPIAAGANNRFLSGFGLGENVSIVGVQVKAYAAWRASGGLPNSIPVSVARTPTIWVQAIKTF
jgi:hemolysin activation/secretion protein